MGKLINIIPGSRLLISSLPARLQERMSSRLASLVIPQAFSKPCLVNFISKDTHLVFSIYYISNARKLHCFKMLLVVKIGKYRLHMVHIYICSVMEKRKECQNVLTTKQSTLQT